MIVIEDCFDDWLAGVEYCDDASRVPVEYATHTGPCQGDDQLLQDEDLFDCSPAGVDINVQLVLSRGIISLL